MSDEEMLHYVLDSSDELSTEIETVKKLQSIAHLLGPEKTRSELLPHYENQVDSLHDEVLLHLVNQLDSMVDYVGGTEYVPLILNLLLKISRVDGSLVSDKVVEKSRNICERLTTEECETMFYPYLESLTRDDWFTSKCTAAMLIPICYQKVSLDKKPQILQHFLNLIQDELPMVRRCAATAAVEFIEILDSETIKTQFIPVFDNLCKDQQESVRIRSISVGLAIARKLADYEIHELLLASLKLLCWDESWRVRQKFAMEIDDLQKVCGALSCAEMFAMYQNCIKDTEQEVRIVAATKLYPFCIAFNENYKNGDFQQFFVTSIIPEIEAVFLDESEDVQTALSEHILSLSSLVDQNCFGTYLLPLVVDMLENGRSSMRLKNNLLKNFGLLQNLDVTKTFKSWPEVVRNLLENSSSHWRVRRNFLIALLHLTKNSSRDYFDENLRFSYISLLQDKIFAVRRVAPVVLPPMMKQFGMKWANALISQEFGFFAKDHRYLYKYMPLYIVEELINPTLDKTFQENPGTKYLTSLQDIIANSDDNLIYIEVLARITKMHEYLSDKLKLVDAESVSLPVSTNELNFYGEETLKSLKEQSRAMFVIEKSELGDNVCYLEGILEIILKNFNMLTHLLQNDLRENVRNRAFCTFQSLQVFVDQLKVEIYEETWVNEKLGKLSKEDFERIEYGLNENLIEANMDYYDGSCEFINAELMADLDEKIETPGDSKPEIVVDHDMLEAQEKEIVDSDKNEETQRNNVKLTDITSQEQIEGVQIEEIATEEENIEPTENGKVEPSKDSQGITM